MLFLVGKSVQRGDVALSFLLCELPAELAHLELEQASCGVAPLPLAHASVVSAVSSCSRCLAWPMGRTWQPTRASTPPLDLPNLLLSGLQPTQPSAPVHCS